MNVEIAPELLKFLEKFAQEEQKTAGEVAQRMIEQAIEDRLDYMEAVSEDQNFQRDGGSLKSIYKIGKELGLEDE